MKLVKFVPALAATLVLAACSNANTQSAPQQAQDAVTKAAEQATQQVNEIAGNAPRASGAVATDGAKSIVYRCQSGKRVTANYVFQGEEAKAVNLLVQSGGKTQKIPTLTRDASNQDSTSFKTDKYSWDLDTGFTLSSNGQSGMLTKYGAKTDTIVAKLCDVDKALTSKLNK